jgi:hypothetical protein
MTGRLALCTDRQFDALSRGRWGELPRSLLMELSSAPRVLPASAGWWVHMRNLVQPLPSPRCEHCDGLLLFKDIELEVVGLDMEAQIFVCGFLNGRIFHRHSRTPHWAQ